MAKLEYQGKTFDSIRSLAEFTGIKAGTLQYRLSKGWSVEDSVQTPVAEIPTQIIYDGSTYDSISELAKARNLDYRRLYTRLLYGWSLEDAVKTPVRHQRNPITYQEKEYPSVRALAKELEIPYSILSHYAARSESIEKAVEKSRVSLAKEKPFLWSKSYESYEEIARAYGIGAGALCSRAARGESLEEAVLTLLKTGTVRFRDKTYPGLVHLCAEFSIQTANVYDRLQYGMSLEEALTKPIRKTPRGTKINYMGKAYSSQISLCREYGISVACVREQLRRNRDIPFIKMFDIFVRLKAAAKLPNEMQLNYIPRCIMNGKPYKRLLDLTQELGISASAVNSHQLRNGTETLFDTLRSMQQKTVSQYMVDGKAVSRKALERQGYTSLKLFQMKEQKIQVPMYPSLQRYNFESGCYDTLYLYKQLLSEAAQEICQDQEPETPEWGLTM